MVFELKLAGIDNINSSFDKLSRALDAMGGKLDSITSKMNAMATAANNAANSVKAAGSAAGSGSASGQFTKAQLAMINAIPVHQPAAGPVPPVIAPPVQPPPLHHANAAAATAMQTGVHVADFIIKNLANPSVLAAGAIAALAGAANAAAESVRQYADFTFQARGGESASKLAGIAGAAGVDLGAAAGDAASRPGGSVQLLNEIDQFRNIKDDDAAARFAQVRKLEKYRAVRNLTDEQYSDAKNFRGNSADDIKRVDRAMADFGNSLQKLYAIGSHYLIPVMEDWAMKIKLIANGFALLDEWWRNSKLGKLIERLIGANPGEDKQLKAGDKMDQAANKMNEAATKLVEAMAGGGPRARNAFPAAYAWYGNAEAARNNAKYLGSITN
jgi:hypothetical protein